MEAVYAFFPYRGSANSSGLRLPAIGKIKKSPRSEKQVVSKHCLLDKLCQITDNEK